MKTIVRTWLILTILIGVTACDTDNYWEDAYFDSIFDVAPDSKGYFRGSNRHNLQDIYFKHNDVYGDIQDIHLRSSRIEIECLQPREKNWDDGIDYIEVIVSGFDFFIFSFDYSNMPLFGNRNVIVLRDPNFTRFMQEAMIYLYDNGYRDTFISVNASLVTTGRYYYPLRISLFNDLDVKIRDF